MPQKKTNKSTGSQNHVYRGCRDAVTTPQTGQTPPTQAILLSSDTNGTAGFGAVFAPLGLTSCTLGASSYTVGTPGNVLAPNLRGLFNKASDFQWYRISRAKFVAVTVVGANSPGSITLAAYADPLDVGNITTAATVSGINTKSFPLSSAAGRELSVPFPVDSSWKKVSGAMTMPGNVYPFNAANAGSIVVTNTVGDLSFGAVYCRVAGATPSVPVASYYIEYDVEFKGPIDSSVNL